MSNIVINNKVVSFNNPNQIINMGGPWVGDLIIGNNLLMTNVVIDNLVYQPEYNKLLFVNYNNISKWLNDNYFTINYLDIDRNEIFMFCKHYKIVYIEGFVDIDKFVIYNAFHNKDATKRMDINFEKKDFILLK